MARYRIMAIDETGAEVCMENDVASRSINHALERYRMSYEEYRHFWFEREGDDDES
jgi:hypothetical protein